jgi:hypothetical protein
MLTTNYLAEELIIGAGAFLEAYSRSAVQVFLPI